ncbi:hypothetical protein X975_16112, partial [Stegodyphus mimosarum]
MDLKLLEITLITCCTSLKHLQFQQRLNKTSNRSTTKPSLDRTKTLLSTPVPLRCCTQRQEEQSHLSLQILTIR